MPIDSHSSIEAVGNEFRKAMQVPCIFFIVHGRLTDAESSFGKLVREKAPRSPLWCLTQSRSPELF